MPVGSPNGRAFGKVAPRTRRRASVSCKFCLATSVVKNGTRKGTQYWLCKVCGRGFVSNNALPRRKYAPEIITAGVTAYLQGSSLNEVCEFIEERTHLRPSQSTVHRWVEEIGRMRQEVQDTHRPKLGDTWQITETLFTVNGRTCRLLSLVDSATHFLVTVRLSRTRGMADVRLLVESARDWAGLLPRSIVANVRWMSNHYSLDLPYDERSDRVQIINSGDSAGGDAGEAWHQALRKNTRAMARFKSLRTARKVIDTWRAAYNFLGYQESLDHRTPAQAAGTETEHRTWRDIVDFLRVRVAGSLDYRKMELIRSGAIKYRSRKKVGTG